MLDLDNALDFLEIEDKDNFELQLPHILSHIMHGEIKKGKSFGIHYFQEDKHQIEEIIKAENEQGIWEAKIKIRHPKTGAFVTKNKSSTFFPRHWSYENLVIALSEAFKSKERKYSYLYIGKTSCGIKVTFFFKDNRVVSCFPLYAKL